MRVAALMITVAFAGVGCGRDGKQPSQKVVVLSTAAAKILVAVGAKSSIAAVNIYIPKDPLLKAALKGMPQTVGTATNPSLERIAAVGAGTIITWNRRTVELLKRHFGTAVELFRIESFGDLRRWILEFGRRFGSSERAKDVLAAMDEVLAEVRRRLKGCTRKRAVFCFSEPERVKGGRGIVHEMMTLAGLSNIAAEHKREYVTIGREALAASDPEVVFIWDWARFSVQDFCRWFPMVTAVKERMVLKFPPHTPVWAPDCVLTVLRMAMFAHPERFADLSYEDVADRFMRRVYGVSLREMGKR